MDGQLQFPLHLIENFHLIWTYLLVVTRYTAMISVIPGIGEGAKGLQIRIPAVLVMSYTSMVGGPFAEFPDDWALFIGGMVSEVVFGMLLGLIPTLLMAGVQTAAQLASTTMGLGAAQLMDPTMGTSVSALGRIFGDVTICFFLVMGGHLMVVEVTAGLGGVIVPGSFLMTEETVGLLVERTAHIFTVGVMIAAPVIVALLLTQFVMGLISRAVPTVNIFIVSFPLTIGIGLMLSILALPEVVTFVEREFYNVEDDLLMLGGQTRWVDGSGE